MSTSAHTSRVVRWRHRHSDVPGVRTPLPTPTCVFVFSGGGMNGAAQAGMVRELLNHGITPDAVVGVSAGALNAVYLASTQGHLAGDGLVAAWEDIAREGIYDAGAPKRLWAVLRHQSSVDPGTRLAAAIQRHCPIDDLDECRIPVLVGTLNLGAAKMHWWNSGSAHAILRASTAIPGMFPPVELDGGILHVDGGTCSPIPLEAALGFRPTRIIVLDVALMSPTDELSAPMGDPAAVTTATPSKTALTVLLDSFEACRRHVAAAERSLVPDEVEVVTIRAGVTGGLQAETAQRIPEIIELGAEAARRTIAAHPELLLPPPLPAEDPTTSAPVAVSARSLTPALRDLVYGLVTRRTAAVVPDPADA